MLYELTVPLTSARPYLQSRRGTEMALAREFSETVRARAESDPEFRVGLLREAVEAMLNDDHETAKLLLGDYVSAAMGIETSAEESE